MHGDGVTRDCAEALKLARRAAEKGENIGEHVLGELYRNGWGVAKSAREAVTYHARALVQGSKASKEALFELATEGVPEATAFYIHARVHKNVPRGKACFHTHMPNATALAMLDGPPLAWAGQTALKFYGRTVVDEEYGGLALDEAEGDRIAASIGEADIVFMRNHGVMVLGPSIAEAWDDLYYLERACEVQRLALSTHRPLKPVPPAMAAKTYAQMREGDRESAKLHLESIKRILAQEAPDFAS
jgi:ribulose-5-phosphate 4-epimerase/fuculose-1-phosphate aldolase